MLFKFKTIIRRFLVKLLNFNRPTSYPFVTGDGFRSLAQHVFDELSDIKPENVETNDIVFVRSDFIKEFFEKKHPLIKNKYILISHNMDTNIDGGYEKYIDDKIIHWFAQNLLFKNEKITPIPIGITNYYYSTINNRGSIDILQKNIAISDVTNKKNNISFGFYTTSNKERVTLNQFLEKNNSFYKVWEKEQFEYFNKLLTYKFTVSPEGNGIDCFRTWESIYLGVIPIVKKSISMEYFKNIDCPMIIVENWDELKNFNEDFLNKKYMELKDKFRSPHIYMNYWINTILEKKFKNK